MKKELIKLTSKISNFANKLIILELEKNGIKGIVPSHGDILALLYKEKKVTMKEIADFVHKTKPTVTTLVDKLVGLNYITKSKCETDSRVTFVELTKKGELLEPIFEQISNDVNKIVYSNLSEDESKGVEDILRKVLTNLLK
jgi:DNA-binding MarR family transcriptional regulator